jgi:hypothetical protein
MMIQIGTTLQQHIVNRFFLDMIFVRWSVVSAGRFEKASADCRIARVGSATMSKMPPPEQEMQKFQNRRLDQFVGQFLQPGEGEGQLFGGLVAHVGKTGKDGDAGIGCELSRIHGANNGFL